jgi:superfamily II DNA or RNA helicase
MGKPIHFDRNGRVVLVSGPNRSPLPASAYAFLLDALTYYERKFDYVGGSGLDYIDRKIYCPGPVDQTLIIPIGMVPRVAAGLRDQGYLPIRVAKTLVAATDLRKEGYLDWDALHRDFKIYPDQEELLTKVVSADGGIISAPTGAGKSVCIRMICALYSKAKIHVVTKSATLADEIFNDLVTVVPQLGRVGGGHKNLESRVNVFVADSLHHGEGDADIVLADEIHQLVAPKYAEKFSQYTRARIFGFSASPTGRQDGRDIVAEAICGPEIHTMSYQDAANAGRVVPITVEWLRISEGPDVSGMTNPAYKERIAIWQNDFRNGIIAARAWETDPEEQVLIIVKTIDHAVRLKKLLPQYELAYAANGMDQKRLQTYIRDGYLPEDEPLMTPKRLSEMRQKFASGEIKKVISNYVWSTGVNFRNLAVLIRADAAASKISDIQIPGRVCRRIPGAKESALMVDCFDDWDPGFRRKSQSRWRNYQEKGWTQIFAEPAKSRRIA